MNLTLVLSVAICLIGAIVFLINPTKPAGLTELGRLSFFAGLLAFLLHFSGTLTLSAHG